MPEPIPAGDAPGDATARADEPAQADGASGTAGLAPKGSYRRRPYEPGPPPTFSYDVVVATGERGAELRAAQARATKELLTWLHRHRHPDAEQ